MNSLASQLACAYRREGTLYDDVLGLVSEQDRIMQAAPEPGTVLELCRRVETLMAEIGRIEQSIEPAKRRWETEKDDPDGELDGVLASLELCITEIALLQRSVQERLLEYMQTEREKTNEARATINAHKAGRAYCAG